LIASQKFDAKVCDFLAPSINIGSLRNWILFQHNVETMIWERHAQTGRTPLHRAYFRLQAQRMCNWEKAACNSASHVIAVSDVDQRIMRERFGVRNISAVGTGVDLDYFAAPRDKTLQFDFVFVGSMDWMPNVDGVEWFLSEVFPIVKAAKPDARLAIVGRNPPPTILAKADQTNVVVTGTVPDVRPFLWQSAISIVPLRVGGGTRLKIFEAMAAGTPVVATAIGAEGLPVQHGSTIQIADTAQDFAAECLRLLANPHQSARISQTALDIVRANFSWERVTRDFEQVLQSVEPASARTADVRTI
jgi:glycosyltransferase involved in cell wall biosynthesis